MVTDTLQCFLVHGYWRCMGFEHTTLVEFVYSFAGFRVQSRNNLESKGSSHYAAQVERSLPKLLSRDEGRSPLKYIMSVLFLDFEYFIKKIFGLLIRV